jgi:hypothetical protein
MRQEAADYRASLIIDLRRRMTNLSRLRKRLLEAEVTTSGGTDNEINIVGCATIAFSSESPAHPIEHLFDGHSGPGATRWISARLIRSSASLWNLTSRNRSRVWCTKSRRRCESGPKKSASRSPKMEVESIAKSWLRHTTSAQWRHLPSARTALQ